jgi:hypothetical protein
MSETSKFDLVLLEAEGRRVLDRMSINVACGNKRIPRKLRLRMFTVSDDRIGQQPRFDLNTPQPACEVVRTLNELGFAKDTVEKALNELESVWRY